MQGDRDLNRVVIVGGGVSGLSAALAVLDLARARGLAEPPLLVLEAAREVGGKIRTLSEEGFTCEWGVNGFLNKEPRTLELVTRLGLQDRLLPATDAFKNRYIYNRGRLRPVAMHPLKFLFSGLLSFGGMVRLVRELWVPRRPADEPGDESVADFARRRVGPEAYRVLVDPMQTGIFAGDPEQMSVVSCFPRVVEVEREYGSLIKGMARLARERRAQGEPLPGAGPAGHLTSFRGGMGVFIKALAGELGPRVRTGARVTSITPLAGGGHELRGEGFDGPLKAGVVVLACPAHESAALAAPLAPELSSLLGRVPYSPLCVVCLGYRRQEMPHPMDGFGFLAPRDAGLRLLGALWTSTIFPERAPDGMVLVRSMIGGARDPGVLDLSDDELAAEVQRELGLAMGVTAPPAFLRIFRHPLGIPQYTVGHAQRLASMERLLAAHPGLLLGGNAYRGIGVNDCVREAHPLAERVLEALGGG